MPIPSKPMIATHIDAFYAIRSARSRISLQTASLGETYCRGL